MSGDLFSELTAKPQREVAGSDSALRFDYQKNWAFCQMIRKHIDGENYLVAFEFHDDVVFLFPSNLPAVAEFCQVKTSSAASPRKLTSLTTRPNGNASVLGKMFSNFDGICASHDIRVILVSNNAFDFSAKDLSAKNLDQKTRAKLLAKLQAEIPNFDPLKLEKLHFKVTGVSLEAMRSFLDGEAMELFCQKFGEDHGLNVRTWIRLLQSEMARKNSYPSDKINSTDDLMKQKCIGQSFVETTLSTIHAKARATVNIDFISKLLIDAGWSQIDVMRLQKKIPQASNDFYDPTNTEVREIASKMLSSIMDANNEQKNIGPYLLDVVGDLENTANPSNPYLQRDYLFALGVLVYYEGI